MTSSREMTCQELVELVTDYFEDRLPRDERERFQQHLALCEPCRIYLEQLEATTKALGGLSEDALSPSLRDDLLEAFRAWRRPN